MTTHEPFDPLSDLFVAQFAKPAQLGGVNLRALTPFHRALLVIDGRPLGWFRIRRAASRA